MFGKRPNVLGQLLAQKPPLVMGVLNVTPDSFSDGGQFIDTQAALQQAQKMIEEGADIIDIGAESTRPYGGAKPVTLEEELARLKHVLPHGGPDGHAGFDRHHQAGGRALGARPRA